MAYFTQQTAGRLEHSLLHSRSHQLRLLCSLSCQDGRPQKFTHQPSAFKIRSQLYCTLSNGQAARTPSSSNAFHMAKFAKFNPQAQNGEQWTCHRRQLAASLGCMPLEYASDCLCLNLDHLGRPIDCCNRHPPPHLPSIAQACPLICALRG